MSRLPPPPPPPPALLANLDFETYSEAGFVATPDGWTCLPGAPQGKKGLPVVGASVYVEHPTFEILKLKYDLNRGQGIKRWQPGAPPPVDLFLHVITGGLMSGWNSGGFEVKVWAWAVKNLGWPPVRPTQWRDVMARSRAFAYPGALGKAAEVIGCVQQKDKEGKRLLDKFSIPRNPTKKDPRRRIRPEDDPADAELLDAYCEQDVRTEQEVARHIPDLTPSELAVWQCDRAINDRGVQVDVTGIENCAAIIEQAHAQYNAELVALTGGTVQRASELQKLIGWLGAQGVHTTSLDEEHLTELLTGGTDLPPAARRALEIRAAIGSASVKKAFSMRNRVSADGRLRDLFNYHAARTGRVTGDGPQPTNLPNSAGVYVFECEGCEKQYGTHSTHCPWCGAANELAHKREWGVDCAELALETIATRSLAFVEYVWSDAMLAVSGCLRALYVAAPGHDLICSDYSAIEAVVLAELAGEAWRQEVFRTHGKIYETSGAKVMGLTLAEVLAYKEETGNHHSCRKKGKINELSLGYQGWLGALKAFGAPGSDDELKADILAWRAASPAIVELWGGQQRNWKTEYYGVEGMAVLAISNPERVFECRGLKFQLRGDALFVRLLSGRELTYHRPRLTPSDRRQGTHSISYEGWNSNPKNGAIGWNRMETWGGRLVENIVQATARDLQWHGILALEAAGYPVVLHVYDEDVAEVPHGVGSVEELEHIMSAMPDWAAGWPIKAKGGWRGKRYRK